MNRNVGFFGEGRIEKGGKSSARIPGSTRSCLLIIIRKGFFIMIMYLLIRMGSSYIVGYKKGIFSFPFIRSPMYLLVRMFVVPVSTHSCLILKSMRKDWVYIPDLP
jgi:hypothetical protein